MLALTVSRPRRAGLAAALALSLLAGRAAAQDDLGRLDFPNSGAPEAQSDFLRGVLLLHSFEYEDAREAFQAAQAADPGFALAYWGEAMTHHHALWWEQDLEAGRAALAELAPTPAERAARAPTERERAWIAAVEALFGEGSREERVAAHEAAMAELAARWPEDLEAAAFHAVAILGTVPRRDFRTYMQAAAVAEEVFAANPRHPGAAHYLIHSYDDPVHAPLGLRAARVYAEIAPAAVHAQHMVSHIYTALGWWPEVVAANEKAVAVSEERLRRRGEPLAKRTKHSLLWLEYALLQQGRFADAAGALATMTADAAAEPDEQHSWHLAAMRAAFAVARPGDDRLPRPVPLPEASAEARAVDRFATALAELAAGDVAAVRRAAGELAAMGAGGAAAGGHQHHGAAEPEPGTEEVVAILGQQLEALVLHAEGKSEEAVARLEQAVAAEAARPLEYGPPSVVKPSHELLGELLLALGRPAEAQARFAESLERAPRRAQSLAGLERAAAAAGDEVAAAAARATLAEIWQAAEPPAATPLPASALAAAP